MEHARNEHGTPLIALKVLGPDGMKGVRDWVESRGVAEGGQSVQRFPRTPKTIWYILRSVVSSKKAQQMENDTG